MSEKKRIVIVGANDTNISNILLHRGEEEFAIKQADSLDVALQAYELKPVKRPKQYWKSKIDRRGK